MSSTATYLYKFVFPGIFLAGFSTATVVAFVTRTGPIPFAIATVFALVSFVRTSFPLKRVIATDDGLLISNFFDEVLVPYSQIEEVYADWGRLELITVIFKSRTRFGVSVLFTPPMRFVFWNWTEHPSIQFLLSRAELPR